jgi:hypothetical protein
VGPLPSLSFGAPTPNGARRSRLSFAAAAPNGAHTRRWSCAGAAPNLACGHDFWPQRFRLGSSRGAASLPCRSNETRPAASRPSNETRPLRLLPARALCTPIPLLPRPGVTH